MSAPITPKRLAQALREALPDYVVRLGGHPSPWIMVREKPSHRLIIEIGIEDGRVHRIDFTVFFPSRADRDLARRVFDVLDRLEDGDDA